MGAYFVRRLTELVPVLFLASVAVFLIIYSVPGDPAQMLAGWDAPQETVERIREEMGLDQPVYVQYLRWLNRALRGDFGKSLVNGFPVSTLIVQKWPATVELAIASIAFALIVCIPAGVLPALKPHSMWDHVASVFTALAMAVPAFWFGMILILIFAVRFRWFPPSGYVDLSANPTENIHRLILPAVTLGLSFAGRLARFVKSALLDVMNEDYIRTARAKGLTEKLVIYRHAMKNALIPIVTVLGIYLGQFLGGAVVIEVVFEWPGVGRLIIAGIGNRDYPVVMGTLLSIVAVFVIINFLVDLCYALLDPRIRFDARQV